MQGQGATITIGSDRISGTLDGYFWVSYAWTGVAAMICLLPVAAFGCTELLSRPYADRQA